MQAPVEQGTEVGSICYSLEGRDIGKIPIITAEAVERAHYIDYLRKIFMKYLL